MSDRPDETYRLEGRTTKAGAFDLRNTLTAMVRHELANHRVGKDPGRIELAEATVRRVEEGINGPVYDIEAVVDLWIDLEDEEDETQGVDS